MNKKNKKQKNVWNVRKETEYKETIIKKTRKKTEEKKKKGIRDR